jgi:hypothetical protein
MLFSDCTKQIIVPCSSSLLLKENELNNNLKSIENELSKHPKFNLNRINEKNQTILNPNNIINRKKIDKSRKSAGGFIAKWFGSNSGLKIDFT